MAAGRSLKDSDGLRVSSLIHSRSTPSDGAETIGRDAGASSRPAANGPAARRPAAARGSARSRGSRRDRFAGQGPRDDGVVVGHLERTEAGRTHVGDRERLGQPAVPTRHPGDPRAGRRRLGRAAGSGRVRRWGQGRYGHDRSPGRSSATDRSWMGQDPGRSLGLRRDPYLAGRPARTWHLADLASVGCRGVNGPVPQPSLDTCSSVVREDATGRGCVRRGQGRGFAVLRVATPALIDAAFSTIQVVLSSVYWSWAWTDLSWPPKPDCLYPPNGVVMSPSA